jgi:hypothetical protein
LAGRSEKLVLGRQMLVLPNVIAVDRDDNLYVSLNEPHGIAIELGAGN